jgi:hypothetical protein
LACCGAGSGCTGTSDTSAWWRDPRRAKSATAPVAEGYWEERTRRELENMERVSAENRSKFLDPHGLRTKVNFWHKDE